jgi:hypothetical protein
LRQFAALAFSALFASLGAGCSPPLEQNECVALLDHYVELLLASDSPDTSPPVRLRLRDEARAKASRDPAFAECSARVSRGQFVCAMRASNPDGLEQCLL